MVTLSFPKCSAWTAACLVFSALILASVSSAWAGTLTYDIVNYPSLQNGYTIEGAITTDGKLGVVSPSDITGWSIGLSGPTTQYFPVNWATPMTQATSNMSIGSIYYPSYNECLIATPAGLEVTQGAADSLVVSSTIYGEDGNYTSVVWGNNGDAFPPSGPNQWLGTIEAPYTTALWNAQGVLSAMAAPDNPSYLLIATPTPEPSTLVLFGIAALGLFIWRRRALLTS